MWTNRFRRKGVKSEKFASYLWDFKCYTVCSVLPLTFLLFFTTIVRARPEINTENENKEPTFAEPIPNVTVVAGRNVNLPCVVDNLKNYRVAWIHKSTLLTIGNRVITRSKRYKVSHSSNKKTWYLHIINVEEKDRGKYMCQVNSPNMIKQIGYIDVVVSPYLNETLTSSDTNVREGSDVSLRCVAKGSPEPVVTWRREDGQEIVTGKDKNLTVKGSFLNITKASRLHMGAYLCISSNGVPPSLSKRILLNVEFTPMIWIPNQLVGAPGGTDVILQCNLESHPRSVTYWTKEGGIMVLSNAKYHIEVATTEVLYKVQLKLHIRDLTQDDFGSYTCVAKNSLGETEGTIRLYEIPPPASVLTSNSGSDVYQTKSEKLRNGHQQKPFADDDEKGETISGETSNVATSFSVYPFTSPLILIIAFVSVTFTYRDMPA